MIRKLIIPVILIALLIGLLRSHNSSSPEKARATARLALIASQSSCQENASQAYINCSIGVRNRSTVPGTATVYVDYRYSDSGESIDSNADPVRVPAHALRFVYFSHSYNALQHDLIDAGVSFSGVAQSWLRIRVADPNDLNWPNG